MSLGNENNLEKINELMKQQELQKQAEEVNMGGKLTNGVFIDFKSDFGTPYKGWVEFKRPTTMDYMVMGGKKSEYLRQAGVKDVKLVDDSVKMLAHILSTLTTIIVKSPEWLLDVEDIKEPEVLYHVYAKYEVWEDSFRPQLEPSGDSKASE